MQIINDIPLNRIRAYFSIWLLCWAFMLLVLPSFKDDLPEFVMGAIALALVISTPLFHFSYAKYKGYSYLIGIGAMMIGPIGAAILALSPNKNANNHAVTNDNNRKQNDKGIFRRVITLYSAFAIFVISFASSVKGVGADPFYFPYPTLPSLIGALMVAAIVWVAPYPRALSGNPFPAMNEGARRILLILIAVISITVAAYIFMASDYFSTITDAGLLLVFATPLLLTLSISIFTLLISWVSDGFKNNT